MKGHNMEEKKTKKLRYLPVVDNEAMITFLKRFKLTYLARAGGIQYNSLVKLTKSTSAGKTKDVSAIMLYRIAKATEVDVEYLIKLFYGLDKEQNNG
jgi:hypothetical protein